MRAPEAVARFKRHASGNKPVTTERNCNAPALCSRLQCSTRVRWILRLCAPCLLFQEAGLALKRDNEIGL